MNRKILDTEVQDFITSYSDAISQLAFKGSPFSDITVKELIQQIESRRKAEKKLPFLFSSEMVYYPPKLNLEQTSSQITADYKTSLLSGNSIADITGGLGIDCIFFTKVFEKVYHFEKNECLQKIAAYNFKILGKKNISSVAEDGLGAIANKTFDAIYIDPSRRNENKGKVFYLKDCEPNVPYHLEFIFKSASQVLIKTSPMLDISIGLKELQHIKSIHIVAVDNDVKELLWLLDKTKPNKELRIETVNFQKMEAQKFSFKHPSTAGPIYDTPSLFLYEPNAAILKSGAFNELCEAYKVKKIAKHSHLYTSDSLREFPGRRFSIAKVVPYQKNELKNALTFIKANITTRNFPLSVAALRKKWKLKEGGENYLFFTTLQNNEKVMLLCKRV